MNPLSTLISVPMNWPLAELLPHFAACPMLNAGVAMAAGRIRRIVTDSRQAGPDDIFVALRGDYFDAHNFLPQVAAQGALLAVVERPIKASIAQLVVPSTLATLATLAQLWRTHFTIPVIAVAGSNGKTTTKEMVAAILRSAHGADALATAGNLNNEIGVPQTLFNLRKSHRAAVVEMGMNHPGEMARLAEMTRPTVALVNNAQREHQEFMGSVATVAQENGSIFGFIQAGGTAIFPHGTEFDAAWAAQANGARVLRFGATDHGVVPGDASVAVSLLGQPIAVDEQRLRIDGPWGELHTTLHALGAHNRLNAAAAAACAWAAGCPTDVIARGLAEFRPVTGRMQKLRTPDNLTLIDDTYNANPDSVLAAIDVLAQHAPMRILVLGDMGEVGAQGDAFHAEIGRYARQHGVEKVVTLGALARHTAEAFGADALHCHDADELIGQVQQFLVNQQAAVLVKGSRFMKMEAIVQALLAGSFTSQAGDQHVA